MKQTFILVKKLYDSICLFQGYEGGLDWFVLGTKVKCVTAAGGCRMSAAQYLHTLKPLHAEQLLKA